MVRINSILVSLGVFLRLSAAYLCSTLAPLPSGETFGDFELINQFRYPSRTLSNTHRQSQNDTAQNQPTYHHHVDLRYYRSSFLIVPAHHLDLATYWGTYVCVCEPYGFIRDFLSWVESLGGTYLIVKINCVVIEVYGKSYAFCNVLGSRM